MRATKYLAISLAVLAVLAAISWLLRDTLIQRISNPLLAKYGVEVTDVSFDTLATDDATIGHLEIVYNTDTTIIIDDLTLPIGTTDNGLKVYLAGKVSVLTETDDDKTVVELASLITRFLSLPNDLAGSELYVAELSLAPYPTVRDLHWSLTDIEQKMSGTLGSVAMSAVTTRLDDTSHIVSFSLPGQSDSGIPLHSINAKLRQSDQGISIVGESNLDLPAWETVTKLAGIVPDAIEFKSGTAGMLFDVEISHDVTQAALATAALTPTSPLRLEFTGDSGDITDVLITKGSAVKVEATFPIVDWSLQQADAELLVNYEDWNDIPVSVSGIMCETGPVCSMSTHIAMSDANLPIGTVQQLQISTFENVEFPAEGVHVLVRPDATLEISGLSVANTLASRIAAQLVSSATLDLMDSGWRFTADSIDGNIEALSMTENTAVTTPLFLEKILISQQDQVMAAETGVYAPSSQVELGEQTIALPGYRGMVSLHGAVATVDLTTVGFHEDGALKAQHNVDTGAGQLSVTETAVSLNERKVSDRVSPWRNDWDLSAGTVTFGLQADWKSPGPETEVAGQTSIQIGDLAGYYAGTAFTGLSTNILSSYDSATGLTVEPSTISVALIDMGLPIENLTADVALDATAMAVDVDNLGMTAFGGTITADPFSFHTGRDVNNLTLHAESIELSELLTIKEFEAIEVTGSISAELPVTIATEGITIVDGKLTGEPPGGVIRYLAASDPNEVDTSTIGLVTTALSNFEYDSLTAEVNYNMGGDLKLQMRLAGMNPEMEDSRPVVLNLGVENNVPQMLKSLQAARAVEEILEQRLVE